MAVGKPWRAFRHPPTSKRQNQKIKGFHWRQRRQNTGALRSKIRSYEKQLDALSAQKIAIELKMAAPGFYDQSNSDNIAAESAALANIAVQLNEVEEAWLHHQEELEQVTQSGA